MRVDDFTLYGIGYESLVKFSVAKFSGTKYLRLNLEEAVLLRIITVICLSFAFTHLTTNSAVAQIVEVNVGITEFAEDTFNIGWAASERENFFTGETLPPAENSVGINAEIIFAEPEFLKWALSPQPYINGTLNLEGETSYGGAGLLWRQTLGDKFYGSFSLGFVVHTGVTTFSSDAPLIERVIRSQTEIQFGSRILIRPQLSLGYRVTEKWAGEIFFEHLSNSGVFSRVNEGVDNIGFKVARRF